MIKTKNYLAISALALGFGLQLSADVQANLFPGAMCSIACTDARRACTNAAPSRSAILECWAEWEQCVAGCSSPT
jgi:hypothetical protein